MRKTRQNQRDQEQRRATKAARRKNSSNTEPLLTPHLVAATPPASRAGVIKPSPESVARCVKKALHSMDEAVRSGRPYGYGRPDEEVDTIIRWMEAAKPEEDEADEGSISPFSGELKQAALAEVSAWQGASIGELQSPLRLLARLLRKEDGKSAAAFLPRKFALSEHLIDRTFLPSDAEVMFQDIDGNIWVDCLSLGGWSHLNFERINEEDAVKNRASLAMREEIWNARMLKVIPVVLEFMESSGGRNKWFGAEERLLRAWNGDELRLMRWYSGYGSHLLNTLSVTIIDDNGRGRYIPNLAPWQMPYMNAVYATEPLRILRERAIR